MFFLYLFCNFAIRTKLNTKTKFMSSTKQEGAGVYKMTPEQKENLKRFGKKNGLSEQQVQSQLAPPKTAPQPAPKPAPKLQPQQMTPVAQTPQQPISQVVQSTNQEDFQTYFCYQDEQGGNLEIDLITFREKGIETRYLSLLFSGQDVRQNPPVPQEAFLNIESREVFERIKEFFAQLNWED